MNAVRWRGWRRWCLGALVLFVLLVGVISLRYRGINSAMLQQLRAGGLSEGWNVFRSLNYWATYLGQLREDEETGFWDFRSEASGGLIEFHRGDFATAVTDLDDEIALKGSSRSRQLWLGLAHLRLAEAQNCLEMLRPTAGQTLSQPQAVSLRLPVHPMPTSPVCALPLASHHARAESSREAASIFADLMEDGGSDRHLVSWLARFSELTLADPSPDSDWEPILELFYGEKADELRVRHSHLSFEDRATELGVAAFDAGKGVVVEDFDGDGDLDLVTGGSFDPLRYFRNDAGSFRDASESAGFGDVFQSHVVTTADYDGDGDLDLFVGSLLQPDRLLSNDGNARFRDVTQEAGFEEGAGARHSFTWASAWGDVDLDGDLDLFVSRWGIRAPMLSGVMRKPRSLSALFINQGGRFENATRDWGLGAVVKEVAMIGAAFGDTDGDGDPDLFLSSSMQRRSVLLRNQGDRFEVEQRFGSGFLGAFLDVDHDGDLEIFQGGIADARTSVRKAVFAEPFGSETSGRSRILERQPDGRWRRMDTYFENELAIGTMGSSFGDLDNDGCIDFYFGTGSPEPWFILPNLLYMGQREGSECLASASNASMIEGFGTVQKGHGIVFFDFDEDGDQDLYSSLGGMWPGERWPNQLFVNQSDLGRRWLKVRLRGRQTNRFGLGALIRVFARDGNGGAIVRSHHMDQKTGFGAGPYLAHIGLLNAVAIEAVEVRWPVSRCLRRYSAELDSSVVLDEGECGG